MDDRLTELLKKMPDAVRWINEETQSRKETDILTEIINILLMERALTAVKNMKTAQSEVNRIKQELKEMNNGR